MSADLIDGYGAFAARTRHTCPVPDQRGRDQRRLWRMRAMELATWHPRNCPLVAIKDAKGIKDCRAAARAI